MTAILSNPLYIVLIVLAIAVIALILVIIAMHRKLNRFLVGVDANHIGDSLEHVTVELNELKTFRDELESYLKGVEKRLQKGIRSVHTVRFDPWSGSGEGGKQSFATAFMNENGDGVVISSLYSRDHVSIFGKPLKDKLSAHELSAEEQQAVEEAAKNL